MMLRFLRFRTNVRNSYFLAFYAESHNKYHVQIKTGVGIKNFYVPSLCLRLETINRS